MTTEKNSRYLTIVAVVIMIFSGTLLLYTWFNYEQLRDEQAYRLMWHLNQKQDSAPSR